MNTSFSPLHPTLQIALDSTSIGTFKECPRKYYYSIVEGWQSRNLNVHLVFGLHTHSAREVYEHAKAKGKNHEEALRLAVKATLCATWDPVLRRPWISEDNNKNRFSLIRTLVWYLDQFADDPMKTVILASGKPAIELSFRFVTDYKSTLSGETFLLCGHLDRVADYDGKQYILDVKTTKYTVGSDFFSKFTPGNQFSTYMLAAKMAYGLPVQGIIVDAAQVAVTFSRFARGIVTRTPEQLDEWYKDLGLTIERIERAAKDNYWPMNDTACGNYGGCPFQMVCSLSPSVRDKWISKGFVKRIWDPLMVRGEV